jgi:hypothetical protein
MIPSRAPEMPAPMVPAGVVTECVAIKSRLAEIVQTFEVLRCELIVSELIVAKLIVGGKCIATILPPSIAGHCMIATKIMGSGLMTVAAHGVTSKWRMCVRPAVSAQCMATPPMTHVGQATVGKSAAMPATASTVKSSSKPATAVTTAPTSVTTATSASVAAPGDCRSVRDDAKRANRNAGRQNSYRSLRHGTLPTRNSKAVGVAAPATTARLASSNIYNYCVRREFLDVTVPH